MAMKALSAALGIRADVRTRGARRAAARSLPSLFLPEGSQFSEEGLQKLYGFFSQNTGPHHELVV